jgi:hypothetical protein
MNTGGLERVIATICREGNAAEFDFSVLALRELGAFGDELLNDGFRVSVLSSKPGSIDYLAALKVAAFLRSIPLTLCIPTTPMPSLMGPSAPSLLVYRPSSTPIMPVSSPTSGATWPRSGCCHASRSG